MEHVTKPTAAGARRARMAAGLATALLALLPAAAVTATTAGWGGASAQISAGGKLTGPDGKPGGFKLGGVTPGSSNKNPKEWNNTVQVPPPAKQ
ncbi:hypothetical protein ABZ419_30675 [Streptomyces cinnamoneus]|uniref:hypothetical protein n=1 Tax=Streptomyces cinnamoneus TaxID=53446 RepID=UPI00340A251D